MLTELSKGKWCEPTQHGRIIGRISEKGIHVREVIDDENGNIVTSFDEKTVSLSDVLDFANGQKRML